LSKKLKGQCHEIFDLSFFHEFIFSSPRVSHLDPFEFLFKFVEIIADYCSSGIGSKLAAGVVDTGGAP
jgi:hypothetical protein